MTARNDLIRKYDVPVPRYTSYPTVPYWQSEQFEITSWWEAVKKSYDETNATKGISLYLHLPFCESLCTYCACNTRITRNHKVEGRYIDALLQEWDVYKKHFADRPVIREIHLGGGTPTFFSSENLSRLLESILDGVLIHQDHEFSFEGHPNNTTTKHLQSLYDLGFRRVSYGVQDLDSRVQRAINRIQPFENLKRVVDESRSIGYESISFDLVYGLPYQTIESVSHTVEKIIALRPDRIAFYSYAHVPWIKPGQRGYEDADLPTDVTKRALYEIGRKLFHEAGYIDIGMDHFALPSDSIAKAFAEGRLHRNFMGYSTTSTDLLVGLGTSAISDAKYAYAQNLKKVEAYEQNIRENNTAIFKGHSLTSEDLMVRRSILSIACQGKLSRDFLNAIADDAVYDQLNEMHDEGLIHFTDEGLEVTSLGRVFIRNICAVFDLRMKSSSQHKNTIFSKAI